MFVGAVDVDEVVTGGGEGLEGDRGVVDEVSGFGGGDDAFQLECGVFTGFDSGLAQQEVEFLREVWR